MEKLEIRKFWLLCVILVIFCNSDYLRLQFNGYFTVGSVIDVSCSERCRSHYPYTSSCGLNENYIECLSLLRSRIAQLDELNDVVVNGSRELVFLGVSDLNALNNALENVDYTISSHSIYEKVESEKHIFLLFISLVFAILFYWFYLIGDID